MPELAEAGSSGRSVFLFEESDGNLGEIAIVREKIEVVAHGTKRA